MIWSLIKILLFIGIAAGLTYGAGLVMETPGEVRIAFAGRELNLSPLGFLIAVLALMAGFWVVMKLVGLVVAVLRFLTGDQTAITRYFDRNRERKGFDALGESLIALAAGEGRKAQAKALQAEKLLDRPDITRLINAQAAELSGNKDRALGYYKEMLAEEATRFVGIQGVMKQKLAEGDTDTALKLAEKAYALKPKHPMLLDTMFDLQSRKRDWTGARKTLTAKVKAATLPKDVGRRREAVLSLAEAHAALVADKPEEAREAAYAANRLAPTFVPAAALAAKLHAKAGDKRQAERIVRRAWSDTPHPDLAAAFAAIEPDEKPDARQARFQSLLRVNPDNPETRMVAAELALAAEDFPAARRALGDLAQTDPTIRSLAIMAAIERGEGAPDHIVRGWLARALDAPQARTWVCEACNTPHGAWEPVCENCDSFDTLSWAVPPRTESQASSAAMLPVIVGALSKPATAPEPEPAAADPAPGRTRPDAEDAVTTDVKEDDPDEVVAQMRYREGTPADPKVQEQEARAS